MQCLTFRLGFLGYAIVALIRKTQIGPSLVEKDIIRSKREIIFHLLYALYFVNSHVFHDYLSNKQSNPTNRMFDFSYSNIKTFISFEEILQE